MKNLFYLLILFSSFACKKRASLKEELQDIINDKKAKVGIVVLNLQTDETTEINGNEQFPMQSVFKYHVAVKVLDEVDNNKWSLSDSIAIKAEEILSDTWSPLRDEYGSQNIKLRLYSLIHFMVSKSDNNACDILLRRIGGPEAVNAYFKKLGFTDFNISFNEEDMHKEWENQYKNYSTPISFAKILTKFYLREYLSGDMHDFLFSQMANTNTGENRLKAGVPEGTTVAHKTGTSARNKNGLSAATNDAGFIILPDGKAYVVVVFITDSEETDEVNEEIIAEVARVVSSQKQ